MAAAAVGGECVAAVLAFAALPPFLVALDALDALDILDILEEEEAGDEDAIVDGVTGDDRGVAAGLRGRPWCAAGTIEAAATFEAPMMRRASCAEPSAPGASSGRFTRIRRPVEDTVETVWMTGESSGGGEACGAACAFFIA